MKSFTAWYADGNIYHGSSLEEWKALPAEGVVYLVVEKETGRTLINSADWYYWHEGEIKRVRSGPWGTDQPPPAEQPCLDCVKKYGVVSDAEFHRIDVEASRGC